MKNKSDQPRQGDVLLVKIDKLPSVEGLVKVPRDKGRVILAYGEATGHAHAIEDSVASLFERSGVGERYLVIEGDVPVALKHEEHGSVLLDPGIYEVGRQQEYDDFDKVRQVAD